MKSLQILFAGLIIFSLVAGCTLGPNRSATPTPTIPPTFTVTPSITPIPSPSRRATFVPIPTTTRGPSVTPMPLLSPIPPDQVLTIQALVTQSRRFVNKMGPFQCKMLSQYPEELTVFRPKEEFMAIWRFINAGEVQWGTRDVAYFYISGTKFHTAKYKEQFIPYVVNIKDQLNLHVPMRAPAEPGVYFAIWGLRSQGIKRFFCTFSISILVEIKEKK